jgi:hypothetical protein
MHGPPTCTTREAIVTVLKVIGVLAGVSIIALIGGGFYLAYKAKKGLKDLVDDLKDKIPTNPEKRPSGGEADDPPFRSPPSGLIMDKGDLPPELVAVLDEKFQDFWPPDDEVIDNMTDEDVVVFAVESEPVGNYTATRQELISAKVLSVETNVVRARVIGAVVYAEHHGAHAGHGFRVGDLVEVPRSQILLAARPAEKPKPEYDGHGKAAQTFKPSELTKQVYQVRPGTPYDLVLPYRTDELEWHVDRDMVTTIHLGNDGLLEQIMFSEDSMRGAVTVRVQDRDPKEGLVHVARWDFTIAP